MDDFMIMNKMVDVTISEIRYECCLYELSIVGGGVNYFLEDGENKNFIQRTVDKITNLLNKIGNLFKKKKVDEKIKEVKENPILMKKKIKMHDIKALQKVYDDAKSDAEKAQSLEDLKRAEERYKDRRDKILHKTALTLEVSAIIGGIGFLLYGSNDNFTKKVDGIIHSIQQKSGKMKMKKIDKKMVSTGNKIEPKKHTHPDPYERDYMELLNTSENRYVDFLSRIACDMIKDSNVTIDGFFNQLSDSDKKELDKRLTNYKRAYGSGNKMDKNYADVAVDATRENMNKDSERATPVTSRL